MYEKHHSISLIVDEKFQETSIQVKNCIKTQTDGRSNPLTF